MILVGSFQLYYSTLYYSDQIRQGTTLKAMMKLKNSMTMALHVLQYTKKYIQ